MTIKPAALFDPVVGNIGMFDAGATVALHFTEPLGVMPSDARGNLGELAPDAGTTDPTSVDAWSGKGRQFRQSLSAALLAVDAVNGNTLLTRDATIQAILALTLSGAAGAQTIYVRGTHSGAAAEAFALGLEVQETAPGSGLVDIRLFWEDSGGTIRTQTAGTFAHAGDGVFFLLTATRRWASPTSVVVRYYVNDQLVAEVASANGDIAGGTTGHTTIGARKSGGAWSKYLNGAIDELVVLPFEISGEEIRETYRRLALHQPAGVEMFSGLAPPGVPWTRDPSNNIGRHVKVAGQALGTSIAAAEELRALWLPDAVPLAAIERWERVCKLSPRALDSLDTRRARVIAFLSRIQGYTVPALKNALAPVLVADTADLEILEFSQVIDDKFATLELERWLVGSAGTWAIAANELKVTAAIGADIRWEPSRAPCHVRMSMGQQNRDGVFIVAGKLSTYWAALPANTLVGLFMYNRVSNNAIWFGVKTEAGVRKLGYVMFSGNVMGAFVPLANPSVDAPYWLRITSRITDGLGNQSSVAFWWSTVGSTGPFTTQEVITGLFDLEQAGFGAVSTDAALATGLQATFDDFFMRCQKSKRPFHWYAYRSMSIGDANQDMIGATNLVRKMKPAQTYTAAIESKSLLCDDVRLGQCDHGPMGAL